MRAAIALIALCLALAAGSRGADAAGCGTPEGECIVVGGMYRLALPDGAEGDVPAVLWLHGWGASSALAMRDAGLREAVTARGYALIAPEGIPREGRPQKNWGVRDGGTHPRDDLAFLGDVLRDAAGRGVDRDRVLMAGFSRGGSMVWDAACREPDLARAYAPVAGAFWEPMPERCAGPVDLHHTHGWADKVVPLEGRLIGGGRLVQGDVFASLATMRRATGCDALMPETTESGELWVRRWESCTGGRLDLVLHRGGHMVPEGWSDRALDWFEDRLARDDRALAR